ncbi:MAG: penicillin acylase family protein [Bdellovibrio sp.]
MFSKYIKRLILGFCLLVLLAGGGVYLFLRHSLAPLDGTIQLENLEHPVTVRRDTYGIPHIEAQNRKEALRALGYVMASERLFQMELSRRMTQGLLSEVFGEAALPSDKLYRSLMLRPAVERMIAAEKQSGRFDQEMWDEMAAYFDGVNQYIATRPLPYEFTLTGFRPQPFTPMDAFIMLGHMAYSFGIALKADPLMTHLHKKLSSELFQSLRNDPLPLQTGRTSAWWPRKVDLLEEGLFTPSFEGSNAWLLAPSRSQSGKSLFANDPHIGFSAPSVWVEAHLRTPDFELYGHFLPLVPFAVLGHSRHHAWGFTMSLGDDMDLYRETLDREKKTVIYNNKPQPYREWREIIPVKGAADVILNLIETPHGPVMDEVLTEPSLALKWAFHRLENNPLKSLREMGLATNMERFEKALRHATAPGLNVMYADAENIAWWMFGDIAIKKNPQSDMILDGASGADEYERLLSWEEKPHLINPPSGVIITANSRPSEMPPNIRGDFQSPDRYHTISELLAEKQIWNVEDTKALQTMNYNSQNKALLKELLSALQLTSAEQELYSQNLKLLKEWDLRSDLSSQAASLFHQWNNENILMMLERLEEEPRESYLNTIYAWAFYERTLLDTQSAWWKLQDRNQLITTGFKKVMEKWPRPPQWGSIHTIEYRHPLGRSFPLNKIFNVGPHPMPGAFNEINNNKMRRMGDDFQVTAGPSTRRIIDFSQPQTSWGINPIGISGHMFSPFYKDQVELFLRGEYRPQLMNSHDIDAATTHTLIFK